MKRMTSLLLAVLLLAAVIILPGCERKVRVYRFAEIHALDYPTTQGNIAFANYVEEKTNGRIKIEVFHSGQLGQERETIEMTQTGAIAFVRVATNPLTSINPVMAALSMPFLYRDRDHMFRVLDGEIGDEMLESLQQQNLLGLCWFDAGFRNFYNSRREIRTPADMAGLKIRVQETPLMMDMIRMLGASPTPMSLGEVYTSIQNGVVDGAENNWPSYIAVGHFEVARFFTVNQHMAAPEMILINTGVWNSFSEDEKRIVKEGALEGARVQRAAWIAAELEHEARAREAGSIIYEPTAAEIKLFADALAPIYNQPAYAAFTDLITRIKAVE
ncbi:MAG: TRAP transporter substrate-binding protein [Treponema sp.]|nr:TRAP transporter substrate-binding protein [Treponema sp.]